MPLGSRPDPAGSPPGLRGLPRPRRTLECEIRSPWTSLPESAIRSGEGGSMPRPTNFVAFIRNVVRDQVQEAVQGLLAGTRATPSTAVYIRKRYLIKGFHYPGGPGAGWR